MKYCSKCKDTKPFTEYWKNKSTRDGYQAYCKPCWYSTVSAKLRGPDRQKHLDARINSNLLRTFGITYDEYRLKFAEQSGVCAICLKVETSSLNGKVRKLAVDHNHETGKVRGLLCANCNRALGQFQEDVEALKRAITYLENWY